MLQSTVWVVFWVAWFFKGSQYLRYIVDDPGAEDNVWTPISPSWGLGTWPTTFEQGIDFAFYATGTNAEKIYFFRGDPVHPLQSQN